MDEKSTFLRVHTLVVPQNPTGISFQIIKTGPGVRGGKPQNDTFQSHQVRKIERMCFQKIYKIAILTPKIPFFLSRHFLSNMVSG